MGNLVVTFFSVTILVCFSATCSAKPIFGLGGHATYVTTDDSKTIPNVGGAVETKTAVGANLVGRLDFAEKGFWRYFATELAADVSLHNVRAKGTRFGDLTAGKVTLIAASWSLLGILTPDWNFSPYLGGGVCYTLIQRIEKGSVDQISYTSEPGVVVQLGAKFYSSPFWSFDFDIKKIAFFEDSFRPKVKLIKNGITGENDNSINPLIVGLGATYYFR